MLRTKAIRAMRQDGLTLALIGARFGLSRQRVWQLLNPEKTRAHHLAAHLSPTGNLCERCEQARPLERHHPDYSKPKDVRWLCRKCHDKAHEGSVRVPANGWMLRTLRRDVNGRVLCPKCRGHIRVLSTHRLVDRMTRHRRCICTKCAHQFSTKEMPEKPERLFVRDIVAARGK